jgi:tRNA(fMet)-specific endonuclease VapC
LNFVLDTNVVVGLINGRHERLRLQARHALGRGAAFSISSVVLFELWFGVANSARFEANANALRSFLSRSIEVLPFNADDARVAGELRATPETNGTPIGPYDLLIAAQVLRANATLITANASEFQRVPELKIEDWTVYAPVI